MLSKNPVVKVAKIELWHWSLHGIYDESHVTSPPVLDNKKGSCARLEMNHAGYGIEAKRVATNRRSCCSDRMAELPQSEFFTVESGHNSAQKWIHMSRAWPASTLEDNHDIDIHWE